MSQAGLIFGDRYKTFLAKAKAEAYALPAVNVISNSTVNAALEAAQKVGSDLILQISSGGAEFFAGKSIKDKLKAQIEGAIAFAIFSKQMAKLYGVNVILHTDHANKGLLPWIDGLLKAGEAHYAQTGEPLFSSHMLDLSEETLEENIDICKAYLARMSKIEMALEIELGVTGGEEDGVNNEDIDNAKLYTQPEDVLYAYRALQPLGVFTIAASFGNVHGVYKPGNVELRPIILHNSQQMVREQEHTPEKPLSLVFHGGSGSAPEEITEALKYGVCKMNIDTDTQFSYAKPVYDYVLANQDRMGRQIGSSTDPDVPNKKIIDPRAWLRKAEEGFRERMIQAFHDLNGVGKRID